MVCIAAYSAGGVYCRAQYPVRHLAERTELDSVCAVRLANDKSKRMLTHFETRPMFDHVTKRSHPNNGEVIEQNLLSSYLSRNNSLSSCEECKFCKLIQEYDHQFGFYGESGAPYGFCVKPEHHNRPITSAKPTSSQGCKHSP